MIHAIKSFTSVHSSNIHKSVFGSKIIYSILHLKTWSTALADSSWNQSKDGYWLKNSLNLSIKQSSNIFWNNRTYSNSSIISRVVHITTLILDDRSIREETLFCFEKTFYRVLLSDRKWWTGLSVPVDSFWSDKSCFSGSRRNPTSAPWACSRFRNVWSLLN